MGYEIWRFVSHIEVKWVTEFGVFGPRKVRIWDMSVFTTLLELFYRSGAELWEP